MDSSGLDVFDARFNLYDTLKTYPSVFVNDIRYRRSRRLIHRGVCGWNAERNAAERSPQACSRHIGICVLVCRCHAETS